MSQLGKRLFSSVIILSIILSTIFLVPHWLFFIVIGAFILIGYYEFLNLVEKKKDITIHKPSAIALAALIPFTVYSDKEAIVFVVAVLYFLVSFFRASEEDRSKSLTSVAVTIFGMVYVVWFCSHFLEMRLLDRGAHWVFYTIVLVKGGDTAAYFIGKNYGKNKLIPHISPNKSVEGAVAGLLATILLSLLATFYLPGVSGFHLLFLGLCVGVIAQLGDLVESLMKREVAIKDSGTIPGLGGMLDVLDSLILAIPFVYYYARYVLGVTA